MYGRVWVFEYTPNSGFRAGSDKSRDHLSFQEDAGKSDTFYFITGRGYLGVGLAGFQSNIRICQIAFAFQPCPPVCRSFLGEKQVKHVEGIQVGNDFELHQPSGIRRHGCFSQL